MSVRDSPPDDTSASATHANHRYYLETGVGYWIGTFTFTVTDWRAFWNDRIGIVNRFLVISMACVMTLFKEARITSILEGFPEEAHNGVVTNEVRITVWGITLYLLNERYVLHPDGRGVTVDSKERFGPIPFLFTVDKAHPAEVVEEGKRAMYYMALLGTDWIGCYQVKGDGDRIESLLTCDWAEGTEVIERVG